MKTWKTMAARAIGMLCCALLPEVPASAQENTAPTDAQIAAVAVVANQNDIDFANIAKEKSENAEVLAFAATMAGDHQAVIDQAVALVQKLGVTPEENALSRQLLADAAKTKELLRAKSGEDFNKAYVDNEVSYHKAVITAVEDLLIPKSENAELKALLQNVVPTLKAHLEHGRMVQQQLNSK